MALPLMLVTAGKGLWTGAAVVGKVLVENWRLVVFVLIVIYVLILRSNVGELEALLVTSQQATKDCLEANRGNVSTINDLGSKLTEWDKIWRQANGEWDEEVAALNTKLDSETKARARERAAANRELQRLMANDQESRDWGDAAVPPDVSVWVCERFETCGVQD